MPQKQKSPHPVRSDCGHAPSPPLSPLRGLNGLARIPAAHSESGSPHPAGDVTIFPAFEDLHGLTMNAGQCFVQGSDTTAPRSSPPQSLARSGRLPSPRTGAESTPPRALPLCGAPCHMLPTQHFVSTLEQWGSAAPSPPGTQGHMGTLRRTNAENRPATKAGTGQRQEPTAGWSQRHLLCSHAQAEKPRRASF